MSRPNADHTLPPGDRDEAPQAAPPVPADAIVGREPGEESHELLPGVTLDLDRLGATLDELQMALGDLRLGRAQVDWAIIESSARRASGLARHIERVVTAARPRRSTLQNAAE